ncbi:MAG: formylglycine-generating enzyme family protein [Treponema sp.]|nr:formylglycine-generating enzyme family protein [Treponema sp.]
MKSEFITIQGGKFLMGSNATEKFRKRDEIQHTVTVHSFLMASCEVTQEEYEALMQVNPSGFQGENLPVETVSWYDTINYCNKRSIQEGLNPAYIIEGTYVQWDKKSNGYRLPTEAEWEYACRAGTKFPYYTGYILNTNQANFDRKIRKTTPVGSYPPNPWGLYDIYGNVWDWCWDWYGVYSTTTQTDPSGASEGSQRCWRGGSWGSTSQVMRSAFRGYSLPNLKFNYLGFRVVRSSFS